MAISRLLLPKPIFHFCKAGDFKSTRWCSSWPHSSSEAETSSVSKRSEAASEKRVDTLKSYVKKCMLHPGVLPKATTVQKKLLESWDTIRGILTVSEKILRNPLSQKLVTSDRSDTIAKTAASADYTTQTSPCKIEACGLQRAFQSPEVTKEIHQGDDVALTGKASSVMGETSSENMIEKCSEASVMHRYPNDTKFRAPESTVKLSEMITDGLDDGKNTSMNVESNINAETSSKNMIKMTASEVSELQINPCKTEVGEIKPTVQSSEAVMLSHSNDKYIRSIRSNSVSHSLPQKLLVKSKIVNPENSSEQLEEVKCKLPVGINRNKKSQEKAEFEVLSCLASLLNDISRIQPKEGAFESTSISNIIHQHGEGTVNNFQTLNASSKVGKTSESSDGTQKMKRLCDPLTRTKHYGKAEEMVGKMGNVETPKPLKHLDEATRDGSMKGLIDSIMLVPSPIRSQRNINLDETDQTSKKGSVHGIQFCATMPSHAKRTQRSLKGHVLGKENKFTENGEEPSQGSSSMSENEENSDVDVAACGRTKAKLSPCITLSSPKEVPSQTLSTYSTEEESTENKLLLRFLVQDVTDEDIVSAFHHCGPILKIQKASSIKGSFYKDVFVYFKTEEALKKALNETDRVVRQEHVLLEAASLKDTPNRISVPQLIGDPDVPIALLKNPSRTVKISELTHDIRSHQLKEALAFCSSEITSFVLGFSSSVGYVEFETEEAKERALAAHSVNVSGKQLKIFRIDTPKTTVVRISNIDSCLLGNYSGIFDQYGQTKKKIMRDQQTVDVHYKLVEWPNMVNILNSLNGKEVDNRRWHAQPAPVFHPEILKALWSHPDGRRHVKSTIGSLLREIENPVRTTQLTKLVARYTDHAP